MDKNDAWMKRSHERQNCAQDVLSLVFDWSDHDDDMLLELVIAMIRHLQSEKSWWKRADYFLSGIVIPRLNKFCRTKAEKEWMLADLAIKLLELGMTKQRSELLHQEIMSPWSVFISGNEEDLEEHE